MYSVYWTYIIYTLIYGIRVRTLNFQFRPPPPITYTSGLRHILFKAVNLAVLMSCITCLWLFYVPRYQRSKMQKKLSQKSCKLFAQYNTLKTTNILDSYFIRTTFCLVIIGTVWHLFSNFEIMTKKVFFEIFYPSLK